MHHRRRRSDAVRLSTDSCNTLPEYSRTLVTTKLPIPRPEEDEDPPGYPLSAEEADQEDTADELVKPPRRTTPTTPVRRSHFRRQSHQSTDPYLDSLLERSVHALELSNALLQSTMSTQSSLSAVLARDSIIDRQLERSASYLDNRIRDTSDVHEEWMDDLDEVVRGVEELFDSDTPATIARSVPSGSHVRHARRRSSHDISSPRTASRPHLRLSSSSNDDHTSPPPRALTQYVSVESAKGDASESTADSDSIFLPSTNGLRAPAHVSSFRTAPRRPNALRLHHDNASMPAIGIRSDLSVASDQSPLSARSVSRFPSRQVQDRPRRGSGSGSGSGWSGSTTFQTSTLTRSKSESSRPHSRSRSSTPNRISSPSQHAPRKMTPPIEELPNSDTSVSDSPPHTNRTIQSLRKILDESARTQPQSPESPPVRPKPPRPIFLPRSSTLR